MLNKYKITEMSLLIDLKQKKILKLLSFLQNPWWLFGIEFSPILLPFEERISTLAVAIWTYTILFLAFITSTTMIYMLTFTNYWWLPMVYSMWIMIDMNTMYKGGRSSWIRDKFRNWVFWKYFSRYFPIRLVKTTDLDPKKNYLIGSHPHGIFSAGAFGAFGTEGAGFSEKYPGISPHIHTLDINCQAPLHREWVLSLGCCSSSKSSISHVLSRDGGEASVLVVGGAAESLYSETGKVKLVLKQRKGFIKIAIINGASLVPSFTFGETELYCQVSNSEDSFLRKFQEIVKSITGVAPCIFNGRGVFQYSFGLMPKNHPLTVVVGAPINVTKNENPSNEEIDEVHKEYMEKLELLFEAHKYKYGYQNINIQLV